MMQQIDIENDESDVHEDDMCVVALDTNDCEEPSDEASDDLEDDAMNLENDNQEQSHDDDHEEPSEKATDDHEDNMEFDIDSPSWCMTMKSKLRKNPKKVRDCCFVQLSQYIKCFEHVRYN